MRSRPKLLGILNVTSDTFSDGGCYEDIDAAVRRASEIAEEGADALDVGGESTRPGSRPVQVDAECQRVWLVLERLQGCGYPIPVSVDTRRALVAAGAAERGATILNDTAALRDDPELAGVAAEHQLTVVLMHRKGTPETMQDAPNYEDVVSELRAFFEASLAYALSEGIPADRLIFDPGLGFGKRPEDNATILANLEHLRVANRPLMVGASRKSFLSRFDPRPPAERLPGSLAAAATAARAGVDWVRVHDVRNTVAFLDTLTAFEARVRS